MNSIEGFEIKYLADRQFEADIKRTINGKTHLGSVSDVLVTRKKHINNILTIKYLCPNGGLISSIGYFYVSSLKTKICDSDWRVNPFYEAL
ncbi:hypothetical protein OBK30_14495 [Empedobacter falsenii]